MVHVCLLMVWVPQLSPRNMGILTQRTIYFSPKCSCWSRQYVGNGKVSNLCLGWNGVCVLACVGGSEAGGAGGGEGG